MPQKFDPQRLSPLSLDISAIRAHCHTWTLPRNHRTGGLIAFEGIYQHGSAGSDDARFIRWALRQFLELARIDGLVIDCSKLAYEWGDDLSFSIEPTLPLLFALNPDQTQAYRYAVNDDLHRPSINAALVEMDDRLRAMKSLL